MPEVFRRHAFVRLAEDAWRDAIVEAGDSPTLRDWLAQQRPLIVRRPCLSEDGREAYLGLALPGKRRLAYRVPAHAVLSIEPPPEWQGEFLRDSGLVLRIFGSHAWQKLTGLAYVTETSDVDLIWDVSSPEEWEKATQPSHVQEELFAIPGQSPRVDLEVVFRGDVSFSWREYLGPADDILIKSNRRVWLESKTRLASLLA